MNNLQVVMTVVALCVIAVVGHMVALRVFPLKACRACKGTGRAHIPLWAAVLTLTTTKAFKKCSACGGSPAVPRKW